MPVMDRVNISPVSQNMGSVTWVYVLWKKTYIYIYIYMYEIPYHILYSLPQGGVAWW